MKFVFKAFMVLFISLATVSCSDDDGPTAEVNLTAQNTDFDGDVTGTGGSLSNSYTWSNPLTTVDYNMDITTSSGGSFQLILQDAEGTVVLDQTLVKGQGDDSRSGVSQAGVPGDWTVQIVLSDFNGDGSFSISPGN
ncbi:hypothetical protein E7Z59_12605 [Robertkochia marina]|uniref:Uncharacterized protein n=1 Tax=Robertkochia marina TaxID=1227945 RepID=A0A4S3LZA2_9FLAO|nr:hypothetical protein [Robertkochia marina]THD66625.1 hypothetical protein E7Z59_12605 [Robertkochia marina]TRZ45537.1 hypothetical protein D3A96_06025 [Robertkochia marina]